MGAINKIIQTGHQRDGQSSILRKSRKCLIFNMKIKKMLDPKMHILEEHLYEVCTKFSPLQLPESSVSKLDSICRSANTVLVAARSYGLVGLVRVSIKVFHMSI